MRALSWLDLTERACEPILKLHPNQRPFQSYYRNAAQNRGEALAQLGRHAEAIRAWDAAVARDDGRPATYYRLRRARSVAHADPAAALAEVRELTKADKTPVPDLWEGALACAVVAQLVPADESEKAIADCLALLRRAGRAGAFNGPGPLAELKRAPDLNPLRSRADFKAFLAEVEARAGTK